jgi:proteasome beta subunit
MKKLYPAVADADSALRVAVEALYDAADDDSATGGPDLVRGIYPTAVVIDAEGAREVGEQKVADLARGVIATRTSTDDHGPGRGPSNEAPRADS